MNLRLSLVLAGSLYGIAARAQTPAAPLQTTPDTEKKSNFAISLNHIPSSLMVYWLDPTHNEAPLFARETPLMRPPAAFVLPVGIERLSAIADRKVITFFATREAGDKLASIVTLLDRSLNILDILPLLPDAPSLAAPSLKTPLMPSVECVCTVYWIDSLASTSRQWQNKANLISLLSVADLDALNELAGQDRALLKSLPSTSIADNAAQKVLPFAPVVPGWSPFDSQGRSYSMPVVPPGLQIDPDIQSNTLPFPKPKRGELVLSLTQNTEGLIRLSVTTPSINGRATSGTITTRPGNTIVLSGSARKSGLKPPSPRFDTFVLCLTPHIVSPTVQAIAP